MLGESRIRLVLVALSADMEGISQLRDPHSILAFERSYWNDGRRRLTADVAAAAAGLLRGGAEAVVVLDNHGSGNPENVIGSELPPGARMETWNVFDLAAHGVDVLVERVRPSRRIGRCISQILVGAISPQET